MFFIKLARDVYYDFHDESNGALQFPFLVQSCFALLLWG
jgi:hypothetical protein